MDENSIFMDATSVPTDVNLSEKLDTTYKFWLEIIAFVKQKYPNGSAEWKCAGKNQGWFFRINDKKRAIVYLLPRDKFFKVAFVFGQKATDIILSSDITYVIKTELEQARKYAEGRGIRIDIKNNSKLLDIKKLIEIKLNN